jgi:uncharacterized membrane protein required for colicin V production
MNKKYWFNKKLFSLFCLGVNTLKNINTATIDTKIISYKLDQSSNFTNHLNLDKSITSK